MPSDVDEQEWCDVDAPPLPFEDHWLPRRPYAGKTKHGGYYRTSRERALTMPYIESNPLCMRSLAIVDHDGGRADEIAALCGLPVPSYIALNPLVRNGHIVYALAEPVCLTDAARRAPVNLLSRIEAGLNNVLGGDVAYGQRMTKNPRHDEHMTLWGPDYAVYSLKDLAGPLADLGALPSWSGTRERRRRLETSATGRNVDLFQLTRKWSYRRRGDYDQLPVWEQVVHDHAWDRNVDTIGPAYSRGPLEDSEVIQLARSISRWTWRNIHRTFSEEQARRGRLGGLAIPREELARRGRNGGLAIPQEELARRGRLGAEAGASKAGKVGGRVMTDAKREANRVRATKYDMDAIVAAALEV
ncbi:replication initiation protein [Nocardia gipuzkoensis]